MSDLSEQLAYEKDRADKAEAEIERIKSENKAFEEMLEGESLKKEAQIRKLKEDAILTGKNFKAQKAEIANLTAEVSILKEQLANAAPSNNTNSEQLKRMESENAGLSKKIDDLKGQIEEERRKVAKLEELGKTQMIDWEKKETLLQEDITRAKDTIEQLKKYNTILNEKLNIKQESPQKVSKEDSRQPLRQNSSKDTLQIHKLQERIKQLEDRGRVLQQRNKQLENHCRSLQQALGKNQKALKESRGKMQALADDNQSLQARMKTSSFNITQSPEQSNMLSLPLKDSYIEEEGHSFGRIGFSCLLLTKPHYVSPFLEVYQDTNSLQIYKSTRAGCYEKSMGSYKHKFDRLSFDQESIINPIINTILNSTESSHHSIIIFGAKRSGKKELMSKILVRVKDFIMGKIQNSYQCETLFLKQTPEQGKNIIEKGDDRRSVLEVINRVIALGYKNEKGKEKISTSPRKVQIKPNVCYFNLQVDNFRFELACSSHTNISFRSSTTPTALLNHILYSRLPDILQSVHAHRHLILTINPIIDLYQECRNTLSATFCRSQVRNQSDLFLRDSSPARQDLNLTVRRRFDSIERERQQAQLRTRRLEEDCHYYRSRFDELEVRLKGLLNTHSPHNSYLKKSPVTLSYEKLLKFVHSVQAHSAVPISSGITMGLKPASIYIEKDNESVL